MLRPSIIYPNTHVRLEFNIRDEDGTYVDPDTVAFLLRSPGGTETTYTYGTDAEVAKSDTGRYYAVIRPQYAGRWAFRWATTGTSTYLASEGSFNVRDSAFVDDEWGARDYS